MLAYIVVGTALWLVWRVARRYIVKHPLARIPGPPSSSLVLGNLMDVFGADAWAFHDELARYGQVSRITGVLNTPMLYIYDPKALYSILLKDGRSWDEPAPVLNGNQLFLGPGLMSVRGETHRRQRKMLTPVFAVKHLRGMVPVLHDVARTLVAAISARVEGAAQPVDVLGWMSRAVLEMIGRSGMGCSLDPLVADATDRTHTSTRPTASTALMTLVRELAPGARWQRRLGFVHGLAGAVPARGVRRMREIVDVLAAKSRAIYEEKKAAAGKSGGVGEARDIMSILLRENMEADEADKLPEDQLMGQISTILFAAMDTTSNALSRTLHLLSEHPEVQDRLRSELQDASRGEEMEYDELHGLPYLDAVCRETLRLYPPLTVAFRESQCDTVLPLTDPIRATDDALLSETAIPRGTPAVLAVRACNRNKALWGEDADEWKPERWLQPVRPELENASVPGVYSHMMTFLGGSRACIGFKLSQLEMKLILSVLVQAFAFERGDRPIVWNMSGVSYPAVSSASSRPEMWLTVRKL